MSKPADFNSQLSDLTAKLTGMVAERLAQWSKDMDPGERHRILEMIEGQLPNVVANTIAKTPSLHSASGVKYLEENLDNWADTWARKFIGKD
jgi:hypothetical protein